jgi:predicted lipoprotein with Yx(FWY)xxD motif
MTLVKPRNFLAGAVALPLAAVIVAGCGGGSSAPSAVVTPPAASPTANKAATSAPTIRVANSSLGRMLVDAHGRTVYLFRKDKGTKSTCNGACAQAWPPVTVSGKPTAGTGAKASLLGTTKRSDGKTQVTYHGHPLYRFQGDQGRGEANGQGLVAFGAAWFVVSPAGEQISGSTRSGGSSAAKPAVPPAAKPAPPPAAKPAPKSSGNGIPQNNGGDQDSDNNGGPDDGDGGI